VPGLLKNLLRLVLLILGRPTAVLWFFTAGRQSFVGVRLGCNVVGIVSYIGDEGLDIFRVSAVCKIGDGSRLLFEIHDYFLNAFFMAHVILDPLFTAFALNCGGLDNDGLDDFLLGKADSDKAYEQKGKKLELFHNIKRFMEYPVADYSEIYPPTGYG